MIFGSPRILFQRILKFGMRFLLISLENSIVPTVIISGKSNASISLDAESEAVPNIKLADASIKLAISVDDGVAFQIITKDGYFPMIGISGIKAKRRYIPWSRDEWIPLAKSVYANIDYIKKEINNNKTTYNKEFYFGDI